MSGQRRTRIARALAVVAVVGGFPAALPASAGAVPPSNDDFFSAFRVNQPQTTLPRDISFNGTTLEATTQGGEPDQCRTDPNDLNTAINYGSQCLVRDPSGIARARFR